MITIQVTINSDTNQQTVHLDKGANMKTNNIMIVFVLLIFSQLGFAETVTINGFARLGMGSFDGDYSGFLHDTDSYNQYNDNWSATAGTLVGLQLSAGLNENTEVVVQLLSDASNDFTIDAEWVYLNYQHDEALSFKLGRFLIPLYQYSNFLNVSFAYPWISLPSEVYSSPISSVDGAALAYKFESLGGYSTFQSYYGTTKDNSVLPGDFYDLYGLNYTLDYDWVKIRVSHNSTKATYESNEDIQFVIDTLQSLGFDQVAEYYEFKDEQISLNSVGLIINWENWLLIAEKIAQPVKEQSFLSDLDAGMVTLGYQFGDFLLHYTVAESKSKPDFGYLNDIPDGVDPNLDLLKLGLIASTAQDNDISKSIGLRWDFAPSMSFKVEYSKIDFKFRDEAGDLIRFSIDTVF